MTTPAATSKTRSRNYPAFGLSVATQRARELYDRDGKASVSPDVAVQAWGYKGLNGSSLRALAALRTYGLLEDAPNKNVKLSARALTILLEPADSLARIEAIRAAAAEPAVFSELKQEYGDDIPSDAALLSHLVRNANFTEEAAKILIAAFRDTLSIVQEASAGNIVRGDAGAGPIATQAESGREKPGVKIPAPTGGQMQFTWPLSGDAVATLTVTRTLEPDDIETLAAYFQIAVKALEKAARQASASPPESVSEPAPA